MENMEHSHTVDENVKNVKQNRHVGNSMKDPAYYTHSVASLLNINHVSTSLPLTVWQLIQSCQHMESD